jgi:hypothetical protein
LLEITFAESAVSIGLSIFLFRPAEMISNPQNSGVSINKIGGKRGEVKR